MAQTWWMGFVAVIAGWVVTESGRQPWIVQGILRTADATSPVIGPAIAVTFALFIVVYGIIFSAGIYFINRLIVKGLDAATTDEPAVSRLAARSPPRARTHGRRSMTAEWFLPLIWAGIIGSAVVLYVILDGFDLGIGMLFPFAKDNAERDQMMASIAPFWDGNETWLVMGGVGLLVAFPLAYAIVMPALYLPVIVMLLALVFRGVAFEFREIGANKALWNTAFAGGSTLAGLSQGVILGGMIQGIAVKDGAYAGGTFDWATPFALLCGFGVASGYALLGATWLMMKTKGPLAERARDAGHVAAVRGAGLHGGGEPLDAA